MSHEANILGFKEEYMIKTTRVKTCEMMRKGSPQTQTIKEIRI